MDKKQLEAKIECEYCRCRIQFGKNAVKVVPVIHGNRGVVELANATVFCSHEHMIAYFNDAPRFNHRIP